MLDAQPPSSRIRAVRWRRPVPAVAVPSVAFRTASGSWQLGSTPPAGWISRPGAGVRAAWLGGSALVATTANLGA